MKGSIKLLSKNVIKFKRMINIITIIIIIIIMITIIIITITRSNIKKRG